MQVLCLSGKHEFSCAEGHGNVQCTHASLIWFFTTHNTPIGLRKPPGPLRHDCYRCMKSLCRACELWEIMSLSGSSSFKRLVGVSRQYACLSAAPHLPCARLCGSVLSSGRANVCIPGFDGLLLCNMHRNQGHAEACIPVDLTLLKAPVMHTIN